MTDEQHDRHLPRLVYLLDSQRLNGENLARQILEL